VLFKINVHVFMLFEFKIYFYSCSFLNSWNKIVNFALNRYFDVQNSLVRRTQADHCTVVLSIGMALNAEMQIVTLGDTDIVQAGMVAAVVIQLVVCLLTLCTLYNACGDTDTVQAGLVAAVVIQLVVYFLTLCILYNAFGDTDPVNLA
jgi:hypothetical protein